MFNRLKNGKQSMPGPAADWLRGVGEKIGDYGRQFAEGMNAKTSHWSRLKWKVCLLIFCVISSGLTVYSVFTSIRDYKPKTTLNMTPIRGPKYATGSNDLTQGSSTTISDAEYVKLRMFDNYIDSLRNNTATRASYDSIIKYRSGLLDSIRIIERMYLAQRNSIIR